LRFSGQGERSELGSWQQLRLPWHLQFFNNLDDVFPSSKTGCSERLMRCDRYLQQIANPEVFAALYSRNKRRILHYGVEPAATAI
jgi:hypothetical protein